MTSIADDRGIEYEKKIDWKDKRELEEACADLDKKIKEHGAGLDAPREQAEGSTVPEGAGPGLKRLRDSPNAETIRQQTLTEQHEASAEAEAAASQESSMNTAAQTTGNGVASPKRAAAPKKAKAKKAAAPKKAKAAKKVKAAKAAKTAGRPRATVDENQKILEVSENPKREGTGAHERFEALRKAKGKTIKTFLANGGNLTTLKNAVKAKKAKIG
jgi:hypothetical protein